MSVSMDIYTIIKILKRLRELDAEMPIQMAQCFLHVALRPGLNMKELGEETGLSQSSASRNIQTLGKWHRIGKPGYDIVETFEDPDDTRRKLMFLTPKGRRVMSDLLTDLRGVSTEFDSPEGRAFITSRQRARQSRYRTA